ncbi:T9SS type A sorting domain-containing protein [Flavobacteriaceae bacterium]|nr:T9SS type A sorting domain-containing protein [Flavobacteriaceae bacterium]
MKQYFILSLLALLCITNLKAQAIFDWENASQNGAIVEQTVNTITATFTVSSGNPFLADGDGYGGTSGFLVGSADNNTDTNATLTFSEPVNIQSLFAVNAYFMNPAADWTFTPTGGNNTNVVVNVPDSNSNGVTVTLNWTDITQITVTSSSGPEGFAFDNIISVIELSTQEFKNSDSKIELFPNPSTEYIQLSNLIKTKNYKIYNIIGDEIIKGTISNREIIDIRILANGLYFLKFEDGNTIKFIKK